MEQPCFHLSIPAIDLKLTVDLCGSNYDTKTYVRVLADGALVANNPSLLAAAKALAHFPQVSLYARAAASSEKAMMGMVTGYLSTLESLLAALCSFSCMMGERS